VAWIKDGWFTFDKFRTDETGAWRDENCWNGSIMSSIHWNNPNRDETGYNAADAKLCAATTAANRQIQIGTPAEGLKALQEFESATFH
jgi:hypothetical protein